MRAVWWRRAGGPEVLVEGEAPDPRPEAGEVLIRVAVAGVTFVETQVRAGRAPWPVPPPPGILGNGVGGTIAAVGDRVDPALVGRLVVSSLRGRGGYAELAVAAADGVHPVPEGLSLTDAVALLADGRTALGLHRLAAPAPGESVLVEAAAGGVGSLLVQLASAAGARVIAAASGASKLELARSLGATATVDYTAPGWPDRLAAEAPAGLDVAFDGVGGETGRTVFEAVARGGRFLPHGLASGSMTETGDAEVRGVRVIGMADFGSQGLSPHELAAAALTEAAAGRLRPVIGQTYPLAEAARAHATIEARQTIGKTLLLVE
ncbi:zinc-binding dehydrogenase [Micromonospora sp. NPDC049559]|uniref:zinc-binding dehydrogenase n=1 Tax=Micromonospora sp. NPDC049559 TaxID=3155923 RepID=UPI003415E24F